MVVLGLLCILRLFCFVLFLFMLSYVQYMFINTVVNLSKPIKIYNHRKDILVIGIYGGDLHITLTPWKYDSLPYPSINLLFKTSKCVALQPIENIIIQRRTGKSSIVAWNVVLWESSKTSQRDHPRATLALDYRYCGGINPDPHITTI